MYPTGLQNVVSSSSKNRGINKYFEIPQKPPHIPRNIAGIFVRQGAELE